jgi:site-specific DNA-methyltransferase (adenine-specific)
MNSIVYNEDCLSGMKRFPDKYFDLAVVDPPYGINIAASGSIGRDKFTPKNWDEKIPDNEYFIELQRVSKNQIVWGGNYFPYLWNNGCKGFICWNKLNHHDNRADVELAWTSFNKLAKYFEYMWDGNRYGTKGNIQGVGKPTIRIHPTQKPVALYDWIFHNYAKPEDKILDTHLGSGSSRIAAFKNGLDFTGFELDKEYFEAAEKRFKVFKSQLTLF